MRILVCLPRPAAGRALVVMEREFVRAASSFLLCRMILMGGRHPDKRQVYDLASWQIGELDYACECHLILKEYLTSARSGTE
jgi:hypothetical protein